MWYKSYNKNKRLGWHYVLKSYQVEDDGDDEDNGDGSKCDEDDEDDEDDDDDGVSILTCWSPPDSPGRQRRQTASQARQPPAIYLLGFTFISYFDAGQPPAL